MRPTVKAQYKYSDNLDSCWLWSYGFFYDVRKASNLLLCASEVGRHESIMLKESPRRAPDRDGWIISKVIRCPTINSEASKQDVTKTYFRLLHCSSVAGFHAPGRDNSTAWSHTELPWNLVQHNFNLVLGCFLSAYSILLTFRCFPSVFNMLCYTMHICV